MSCDSRKFGISVYNYGILVYPLCLSSRQSALMSCNSFDVEGFVVMIVVVTTLESGIPAAIWRQDSKPPSIPSLLLRNDLSDDHNRRFSIVMGILKHLSHALKLSIN